MIDSCADLLRRAHRPPPSCLSLPARSRVRKWKTALCCRLGFRLWTARQILQPTPPAKTLTFNRFQTAERWLDGYRRVLSTAARGKLFKRDRRAGPGGLGCHGRAEDCQCQRRLGVCLSASRCVFVRLSVCVCPPLDVCRQRANMLTLLRVPRSTRSGGSDHSRSSRCSSASSIITFHHRSVFCSR